MSPEWLWLGAAIAGYVLVMVCNPLRGVFVEAYDLLRGSGQMLLLLPMAVLSLVPAAFDWKAPEAAPEHHGVAVMADGAALFSSAAGLRAGAGVQDLTVKTRAALSIGAMFWAAWMVGLQFYILVTLYLRTVMPERDPGLKGLVDFAWRRTVRFWPGILLAGGIAAISLWLVPGEGAAISLWAFAALLAALFAFVQVSLLSGERSLGDAVRSNFDCWRKLPYKTVWFLVIVAMHLFLLHASDASASVWAAAKSGFWAVSEDVVFALVRSVVMLWLMAAWVLFFCAHTKNPSRRRIRP